MQQRHFDCGSIAQIDPEIAAQIGMQISQAAADCYERPKLAKDRVITITVRVAPRKADESQVEMTMDSKLSLPAAQGEGLLVGQLGNMVAGGGRTILFNPDSPANPLQGTLFPRSPDNTPSGPTAGQ